MVNYSDDSGRARGLAAAILTDSLRADHNAGRNVQLGVQYNNCSVHEPCNLCGQDHKPPDGYVMALLVPGDRFVCDECAIRHDPRLWALVELQETQWCDGAEAGDRYRRRLAAIETHRGDPDFLRRLYDA